MNTYNIDTVFQSDMEKQLREIIQTYDFYLKELSNLSKNISSSSSWIDTNIKSRFIHTLNMYIKSFETLSEKIKELINMMAKHAKDAERIETAFS